jgi:hypothetical protein
VYGLLRMWTCEWCKPSSGLDGDISLCQRRVVQWHVAGSSRIMLPAAAGVAGVGLRLLDSMRHSLIGDVGALKWSLCCVVEG